MDHDFGVGIRAERMPFPFKFVPKFEKVVDLAVVNKVNVAGLVANGLAAGLQIDNAQPAMPKANPRLKEKTFIVGTAMDEAVPHVNENLLRPATDETADATHSSSPLPLGLGGGFSRPDRIRVQIYHLAGN
jgi:hypothetical protein